MRSLVAAASLMLVAACGTQTLDSGSDPGGPGVPPKPTKIPAADGPVVGLGLVLDGSADGMTGFCLGPVAESYPPQCDGLPLDGWDWAEHRGDVDDGNGTKFGTFAVTGTFDGTTLTYQSAVPGAVYDPMPWPEPTSSASEDHTQAELEGIADALRSLPGALSTMPGDNLVVVDVVHDNGTIQDWVDATYGEGLVFVHSALADASGGGTDPAAGAPASTAPADPPGASGGQPGAVPAASGLVRPAYPATVLDDGDGPQLCLGGMLDSYPPQCSGPPVIGWSWADHPGDYESASGVKWGTFDLVGRFDGTSFTPTEVSAYDPDNAPVADDPDLLVTPCDAPPGGWPLDPPRSSQREWDRATDIANSTKGFVMLWLDQSINPAYQEMQDGATDEDVAGRMNDPGRMILNVQTTGDPDVLDAAIREVFGGSVCVTQVEHGRDELDRVMRDLTELPGMVGGDGGGVANYVTINVIYDDGTYQAWADATYGEGLVVVESALVPAS